MASFHRPLSAMAVAAFAAVSSIELPDKLSHHHRLPDDVVSLPASKPEANTAPSAPPLSGLQFMPRNLQAFDPAKAPVASLPVIQTVYQYAKFAKTSSEQEAALPAIPSSSSDALYRWHLPDPRACSGSPDRSQTVVVLLGWLGSKQKHLKRYADWYTSRGFHAVTFTLPMSDIVSYNVGGKAEKNVEMLSEHLGDWVREEDGKKIVFHTFSNTGWLCYGVILENLQRQDPSAVEKIKGSIIDSAPVAVPDSQVWALGFSAAIMKKHSAATEAVLLSALEKFFDLVLNYPAVNRRLSGVMELLSSNQPNCPQLYIYSSADRVIPAKSVESFVERQRKAGCEVRSCDFVSSPHVDHYRSNPGLYTSQLTNFLEDCVLARREDSSSPSPSA
ncbi:unnamed protein product [Triticum turgidum subsp. durum]|uniref:Transmembrane protein 53 n=1 Tax=Triticum turgidum subsp. durum TaxID=4567 RepID=A0A9R1ADK3_TRITD|nr:unnamed protein product [Triticum turgidum subsp. durum]